MKTKVLSVKVEITEEAAFMIRLEGGRHFIEMENATPDAAMGIITVKNEEAYVKAGNQLPPELGLNAMIRTVVPKDAVDEVYIKAGSHHEYIATVKAGDKAFDMLPSAAVYLAMVLGKPIFFDSETSDEDPSYSMIV